MITKKQVVEESSPNQEKRAGWSKPANGKSMAGTVTRGDPKFGDGG